MAETELSGSFGYAIYDCVHDVGCPAAQWPSLPLAPMLTFIERLPMYGMTRCVHVVGYASG